MGGVTQYERLGLSPGTRSEWLATDRPLPAGIRALEIDTGRTKVGDGKTIYKDLPYEDFSGLIPVEKLKEIVDERIRELGIISTAKSQTTLTPTETPMSDKSTETQHKRGETLVMRSEDEFSFDLVDQDGNVVEWSSLSADTQNSIKGSLRKCVEVDRVTYFPKAKEETNMNDTQHTLPSPVVNTVYNHTVQVMEGGKRQWDAYNGVPEKMLLAEVDTGKFKFGDGAKTYSELPYLYEFQIDRMGLRTVVSIVRDTWTDYTNNGGYSDIVVDGRDLRGSDLDTTQIKRSTSAALALLRSDKQSFLARAVFGGHQGRATTQVHQVLLMEAVLSLHRSLGFSNESATQLAKVYEDTPLVLGAEDAIGLVQVALAALATNVGLDIEKTATDIIDVVGDGKHYARCMNLNDVSDKGRVAGVMSKVPMPRVCPHVYSTDSETWGEVGKNISAIAPLAIEGDVFCAEGKVYRREAGRWVEMSSRTRSGDFHFYVDVEETPHE